MVKNCVLLEENNNLISAAFQINHIKLYVPVVTLSIKNNIKFFKKIRQGSERTVSWNKYRCEIAT